ncbi:hypothetical protein [Paenibacillus caui]|uniref:hypothetical protein n=1 Tax=Paenibacillus caui TaxID=2873927 RepID=UPI001CA987C9|nr:hypothetical protein [Paenibacillus caui]
MNFEWLEKDPQMIEISDPLITHFRIKPIQSILENVNAFSDTACFFIAPIALGHPNMETAIPIPNKKIYDQCLVELAPFFTTIEGVFLNEQELPSSIILRDLTEHARLGIGQLYKIGSLDPVINDLYGSEERRPNGARGKKLLVYKVKLNKSEKLSQSSFMEVWKFIENTFLNVNKVLSLIPTNWYLNDELKKSPAINFFSSVSNNIYLYVIEETGRVIGLDIYKQIDDRFISEI